MIFIKGNYLLEDAALSRGVIINETIYVERLMDDIFSRFFCETYKKGHVLKEMFLSTERVTFEMKRQALKVLFKKMLPVITEDHKQLFPYLASIMEERNIFAHYELDFSKIALKKYPKEIGFVKYKNETKTIWYNEDQLQLHLNKILYCAHVLQQV